MVSLICCYNRKEELDRLLLNSLKRQQTKYELILIDNTQRQYSSAAAALNVGAEKATGDIFAFVHQDIVFRNETALQNLVERFTHYAVIGDVGGVAGAVAKNKQKVVIQGSGFNTLISTSFTEEYREVEAIDECVIMMHRETWKKHPFDIEVCPSWHFYGVETSYYAQCNGGKVIVLNADILHESLGNLDDTFYRSLIILRNHYKSMRNYIVSTCIYVDMEPYSKYLSLLLESKWTKDKKKVKNCIKKVIRGS